MNRRTFLTLTPATIATLAVAPGSAWAQATPGAESALPGRYDDVAPAYEAARQRALTEGREIARQIFAGETAAVTERASPELQTALEATDIQGALKAFATNRVSFAADTIGFFFDGQLADDAITGFMVSDAPYGFSMTRDAAGGSPVPASPIATGTFAGTWSGELDLGGQPAALTVELNEQTGVLSLPELDMTDLPLTGIAFDAERPIGQRSADQGMPLDRELVRYWARYDWGTRSLALSTAMLDDGTIAMLQIAPEPQLPPDPAAGFLAEAVYRLPFEDLRWVFWGGERPLENYHTIDRRQRHAIDLMTWNDGATYRTDGTTNTDYWVYGQPVLAPADGTVTEIQDGVAENTPGAPLPDVHPAGNHITIQSASEEFVILAHLQPETIEVAKGAAVTAGQVIGLTGNSGHSTEPHLHIHLQNEPDFFSPTAMGLPLVFADTIVDGEPVEHASLEQGVFVNRS